MPTLKIQFEVPEGTTIQILGLDGPQVSVLPLIESPVERYFNDFLSNNGRKVFAAAARIEDFRGRPGFTLDDIAADLGEKYESVKSWHRTSGRSAKRWRKETGTQEPIRLDWIDYREFDDGVGERTAYRLPDDVAAIIRDLPVLQPSKP